MVSNTPTSHRKRAVPDSSSFLRFDTSVAVRQFCECSRISCFDKFRLVSRCIHKSFILALISSSLTRTDSCIPFNFPIPSYSVSLDVSFPPFNSTGVLVSFKVQVSFRSASWGSVCGGQSFLLLDYERHKIYTMCRTRRQPGVAICTYSLILFLLLPGKVFL